MEVATRPFSIVYVITKARWGGAQRYVFELACAAKAKGHSVRVVVGGEGVLVEKLKEKGIEVTRLGKLERDVRPLRDFSSFFTMLKLFRGSKPDIVHLNSSKAGGLGALAARLAGVRHIVFTAHGWAFNEQRPLWQKSVIELLSYVIVILCHTTIAVSEAVRRDTKWMPFVSKKITLIKLGIEPPQFFAREEARTKLLPGNESGLWIGSVAELHPTKRISDAIQALALIGKKFPEVKLVVLGEGEERTRLEKQVLALGLSDRVFLRGQVPDASAYLHAFDIFTLPSHTEALSYAVIEAGFAGLPAVITRVGGLPEIVGEDALLVPRNDPKALAEAFEAFIENGEKRKDFGARFKTRVEKLFSLERMLLETFALYARP